MGVNDVSIIITDFINNNKLLVISLFFAGWLIYLLITNWDEYSKYIDDIR